MLSRPIDAIAIGASAGAIGALGQILPALPADLGVPVEIVVHLPPRRQSLLVPIFAPRCALPISEPQDKEPLVPSHVYFAPPDYHLLIEADHSFALSVEEPVNFSRPSIDVLLESAAEAYGARLLAIILTGASRDGARGAAQVRRAGGLVAVQDPNSAEAQVMPMAAIECAQPQLVGSLSELVSFAVRTTRNRIQDEHGR
jgi:two-component system chemotaxis response regulator CheB